MKLEGRVALVTGTSPNIGGGIVETLAAHGAAIVAVDAVSENAEACAAYVQSQGGRAIALTCDVSEEGAVRAAVSEALAAFNHVDILVNNAAFFQKGGVIDMPLDRWNRQIGVILTGAFLCTKYVGVAMIEQRIRGSIVNVISTAGHQGDFGNVAYGAAKAALLNFTRSVAMEFAPHHIRVNSLTPTATDPQEMQERARRWGMNVAPTSSRMSEVFEMFRSKIPLQHLPKPSDYGAAVAFLVSDEASSITGTDLRVDSGALARYWALDPTSPRGDLSGSS